MNKLRYLAVTVSGEVQWVQVVNDWQSRGYDWWFKYIRQTDGLDLVPKNGPALLIADTENKTFTYTTSTDTPMYKVFTSPRGKEVLEYVDPVTGDITGDWLVSTGYNKWAEETGNKVSSKNLTKLIMEVVKSGNKQGLDLIEKTEELLERI